MAPIVERAASSAPAASVRTKACQILVGAFLLFVTVGPASAAQWPVTDLHVFDTAASALGVGPRGQLAVNASGVIYGATRTGGANNLGMIFQLAKDAQGKWKLARLFSFVGPKGVLPESGVVLGKDGALYGTTTTGGTTGGGTVYRLAKVGAVWTYTVLHQFNLTGGEGTGNRGALAFDAAGNVYGTTVDNDGPNQKGGIVYQLKRPASGSVWTFKILHRFAGGNDGEDPQGGVVFGADGGFFGLTGGTWTTPGTLYKITPNADRMLWAYQIVHRFIPLDEGRYPNGTLARAADGTLYGVTFSGGVTGPNLQYGGVVFSCTPAGVFKVIYRFLNSTPNDGYTPAAGPILLAGALYGTTTRGGANDDGIVYRLIKGAGGTWSQTILHDFDGATDGAKLNGPLFVKGSLFYGTAEKEGPRSGGTVFSVAPPP